MPLWHETAPDAPINQRAAHLHAQRVGAAPVQVASAPATWVLVGEHVDAFGGIVAVGLADLQAAAAVSPRTDGQVCTAISFTGADGHEVAPQEFTVSLQEVAQRAAAQQPTIDKEGNTIAPPAPDGDLGVRVAGLVWMMISRQLLSRDTAGVDITVVCDIPAHAGLGAEYAIDVAVALALHNNSEDEKDAPMRARIAEVCSQAAATFVAAPALRARHTAALRGEGQTLSIMDYADSSLTSAPHPVARDFAGFVVAVPAGETAQDWDVSIAHIRRRADFVADACRAFGTESLRLLPDAPERVLDWLHAVHQVNGPDGQPSLSEARCWLSFFESETERAGQAVRALRSRRMGDVAAALQQSQAELSSVLGVDNSDAVAQLAALRSQGIVRAAAPGTANAVIALVPAARAENFAADFAADGLDVIRLFPGVQADLG